MAMMDSSLRFGRFQFDLADEEVEA